MLQKLVLPEMQATDKIMRTDLQQSLHHSHIDPYTLNTFQRILLTTDGTVTHMLEAYLLEPIQVIKLSEKLVTLTQDLLHVRLKKDTEIIERKILLQGSISQKNFLYAESLIFIDSIDEKFREKLLKSKTPIGKIWNEKKIETFKEILDLGKEPANGLANYFNIEPEAKMLFRTYSVVSNRKFTMLITEKFPESYFIKNF